MTPTDKRYDEYQEACAKIMGWRSFILNGHRRWTLGKENLEIASISDCAFNIKCTYLDHASIKSVVNKLGEYNLGRYWDFLIKIVMPNGIGLLPKILQATEGQEAEALSRTLIGGNE